MRRFQRTSLKCGLLASALQFSLPSLALQDFSLQSEAVAQVLPAPETESTLTALLEPELLAPDLAREVPDETNWPEFRELDLSVLAEEPDRQPDFQPASWLQPAPVIRPPLSVVPEASLPAVAEEFRRTRLRQTLQGRLTDKRPQLTPTDQFRVQSLTRPAGDAPGLLRGQVESTGIGLQRRSPVVSDPRIRGSRVGQLAASGSYWVPARIDLNTPLSSIDPDTVQTLNVTRGPFNVRQGSALNSIAFEFRDSPRFEAPELHGATRLGYQSNGEQWNGRQTISGGRADSGFELGYGLRSGSDYQSGDDRSVPSSYHSEVWDLAAGVDLTASRRLEVHALNLNQRDLELPGQAFDINDLRTSGVDLRYENTDNAFADGLAMEGWFNTTRFDGDAARSGKRRQFPVYDRLLFAGATQVESTSTGARMEAVWEPDEVSHWLAGLDVRHVRQELEERVTYTQQFVNFTADSPIPRSCTTSPGFYLQHELELTDDLRLACGTRAEVTAAEVLEDHTDLASIGLRPVGLPGQSLQQVLGRDQLDRTFMPWALFVELEYELDDEWTAYVGAGHSERAPSLTELYAAQPFMFLLQNGLNTVRGDPLLDSERLWQMDLALEFETEDFTLRLRGFHAWINDYITFENMETVTNNGQVEQVNLQYVNTDLATLAGFEFNSSARLAPYLTGLASITFVEGRDHTRRGSQATAPAGMRFPGLPRGTFGGVAASDEEPLPGILPLEGHLALRLHALDRRTWWIELSGRLVAAQDRVATSLLETPTDGFAVWNLTTGWQPRESFSLVAGIENLGNRLYREHLDFRSADSRLNQPGLNAFVLSEVRY